MNANQENVYVAGRKLFDYLEKNIDKVKVLPGYSELYTIWSLKMVQIAILNEKQLVDHNGISYSKRYERSNLITSALSLSVALISFATMSTDDDLMQTDHFSKSVLEYESDVNLIFDCNRLYLYAQNHKNEIVQYGVHSASLITFKELIDSYIVFTNITKEEKRELMQYSGQMAGLFDDLLGIYGTVDILVALLKKSEPEFYSGYLCNRSFDFYKGSIMVKGLVSDAETGDGLNGVNVVFILNNTAVIEKQTVNAGSFIIKSIDEGLYNVKLSKFGYEDQIKELKVINCNVTKLNVFMNKEKNTFITI
jgi:hypothetical protein